MKTRRDFLREGTRTVAGGWLAFLGEGFALAAQDPAPPKNRSALIWSEGTAPTSVYPDDVNAAIAEGLKGLRGWQVQTASIADPDLGLSDAALDRTDVLVWWGHVKHGQVPDAVAEKIVARVRDGGMGFIALHSAHHAKPFRALLGRVTGNWEQGAANDGKPNRLVVLDKQHPIARGVRDFTIPQEERYVGKFDVPPPDTILFDGIYEGDNSKGWQGLIWNVGKGRVFYFRPGHETYPVYFQPEVRRVLRNAVLWAGQDEAGIWEDNDPAARAARATGEPPLTLILRDAGYGGTDATAVGEVSAPRFVKAGPGPVTFRPLAAFGVLKTCRSGWYAPAPDGKAPERTELWKIDAPHNKRMEPPLMRGAKTTFDPGTSPFGLWVATEGFPGETIYTEDALQALIPRFKPDGRHKAHIYEAVKSDGKPVPNAFVLGFEYSTNDDNQEIVALLENARPA